jgi:hypothetical protein
MNERCPAFDRAAILLPVQFGGKDVVINQLVGFLGENGVEYQISVERALELGLLAQGEVRLLTMTSEEQLHDQRTNRADRFCTSCRINGSCNAREEATRLSDIRTHIKA